jgi:2-succinyl-5-enolpyruvyl-6-hydroxy-3-cyclohexene-1-carboxylate synthase
MSNPNTLYARTLVAELIAGGLRHVCLAPGSRNTPLVLAFAERPEVQIFSHLDERSAGFFALGLAIATGQPAALVCTSGSAAANFFPAIVEAHQARHPMLVLTADRPPELRGSGANQTIQQVNLYGEYTVWAVDMALPEAAPPAIALQQVRTTAARAMAMTTSPRPGVVHLNLPFREPLIPDLDDGPPAEGSFNALNPITRIEIKPAQADLNPLLEAILSADQGMIICGPQAARGEEDELGIQRLAEVTGFPILADPTSGMRFTQRSVVSSYNSFLGQMNNLPSPQVIIRIGDVPTSKTLNGFIAKTEPRLYLHLNREGVWADDQHRITHSLTLSPASLTASLADLPYKITPYGRSLLELDQMVWRKLDQALAKSEALSDAGVVYDAVQLLPEHSSLFVGNSLPIRLLDQFGKPPQKQLWAYANRGASGIDGNLSTALGIGAARRGRPLAAIVGDITFYHDMNGLLAVRRCGVPITLVLLNNNGGGIFYRLPISQFDPYFTEYFVTPHGLDFFHAAKLYGLDYYQAESRAQFRELFAQSLENRQSSLIEVRTDAKQDYAFIKQLMKGLV